MSREFALPGSQPQYAPDRRFDIQHYKIDVDIDVDARRIAAVCSLTLTPITEGQERVELDAVELEIGRVVWDHRSLEFSHDGRVLRIELGRAARVGETIVLEVGYAAAPRRGLYFVGPCDAYPDKPTQVWTQGQDQDSRYWFPCFDSPHEKATSELIATVPASFFALSNGSMVGEPVEVEPGRLRFHWRFDVPHSCYLITLAAGAFTELRDKWRDVDVLYYVTPGREEECKRVVGRTPQMLELFSEQFGIRYPYEKYAQVFVVNFIFGGMENTTATTLTDIVLLDERAALDYDADVLVAHELAHQWFGDLLTCRDWGQGWLNEGFATYSEYLWRHHCEGRDAAAVELDDWAEQYYGEDSARYRRLVATNVYENPMDVFDRHLYEKGGLILHMLRQVLGEEGFWASIAHYLRKHRAGAVETRDLARAIEDATGRVLDWFFDQWVLKGAGHPELEVAYAWDAKAGLAQFTVKQVHKVEGDTPLFRLPLSVRFRTARNPRDRDFEIEVTEKQQTFYFQLDSEPTQAIFDPGKHLLGKVKSDKPLPLWKAQLEEATEGIDRIHAARALAKIGGARAEEALAKALATDEFWGVQAAAATALGVLRTDGARAALVTALEATQHPKSRRAVARALGEFLRDEAAAEALAAAIERGDRSYFVEAEACLALGRTRSPRAPEALRGVLDRDSFMDIIRQLAYRGLAAARDDTALGLLHDATAYGRVPQGRRAALGALAELVRGRTDREARDARERAEELLRDPDLRLQLAAVEAIAAIASPASVPALQATVERELDARMRRRCREVIRDIQAQRATNEQLETLREEIDRLRGDSIKLRSQVEKLEAGKPARQLRRTGGKKTVKKT